jgi:hypothetical protein
LGTRKGKSFGNSLIILYITMRTKLCTYGENFFCQRTILQKVCWLSVEYHYAVNCVMYPQIHMLKL